METMDPFRHFLIGWIGLQIVGNVDASDHEYASIQLNLTFPLRDKMSFARRYPARLQRASSAPPKVPVSQPVAAATR
jgi:hypothetical protein